ncbi:MAG: thermonuclease family protein [Chloroflexi bacterium]|nr:thermonuclease family protein [Chloroflexota bacterium]
MRRWLILGILLLLVLSACSDEESTPKSDNGGQNPPASNNNSNSGYPIKPSNLTSAKVTDVVDGDTLDLDNGQRVRLIGINTPEREQPFYEEASDFLKKRLDGKHVEIEYDQEDTDQYGRTLAYIWLGDVLINQEILEQGLAVAYSVPPNARYEQVFLAAEQGAQSAGVGLWKPASAELIIRFISYDPPGPDDENLNGEYVEFQNKSTATVDMTGFTLEDAANNNYTFGSVTVAPEQTLRLYSGCGSDTYNAVYWCSDGPVWNNSGDSAILRDPDGLYIAAYQY